MKKVTMNLKAMLSLLLALVFLAAGLPVLANVTARAEGRRKLYYFSDFEDSKGYVENELPAYLAERSLLTGEEPMEIVYHPYTLESFSDEYKYWEVEPDSLVIFEMREELPFQVDGIDDLYVYALRDLFSDFSDAGCRIMTIFGTDEMSLAGKSEYTEFLTYAEVAVNTNAKYVFMYNVLNRLKFNDFFNNSFLLSPSLYPGQAKLYPDDFFFTEWMVPLYRDLYQTYQEDIDDETIYKEFFDLPKFFGWDDYEYVLEYRLDDPTYVAIGTTEGDEALYHEWEMIIKAMRDVTGRELPIFVLNENGTAVADWIREGTWRNNIFYSGDILGILRKYIPLIMHDFILEQDLKKYANWEGVCDITFKPFLPGEDGWIVEPEFVLAWQKVMNEDDAYKFFGQKIRP